MVCLISVYKMQIAFKISELFQIEMHAVLYTDQFIFRMVKWAKKLKFVDMLNDTLEILIRVDFYAFFIKNDTFFEIFEIHQHHVLKLLNAFTFI